MQSQKCESCRKGFNGRFGNGYMPCACAKKSQIDNTDLNDLLKTAIDIVKGNTTHKQPPRHK